MPGEQSRKIGIITHYYKTKNYGGLLQAYAICRCLNGLGYDAEQLCYLRSRTIPPSFLDRLKRLTLKKLWLKVNSWVIRKPLQERTLAMLLFAENKISHSATVYTAETIQNCQTYDVYITGSDQVWNPDWYEPAFFLTFVPNSRKKIAYAASLGHSSLTEAQAALYREHLRDFSAVSVREIDSVELLSALSPVQVEWLLDPVLLLTREQWDEICADRLVPRPYVFCYFLGEGIPPRRLALDFAKKRKLRVVSIPHLHGNYRKCDVGFGDECLYKVSPEQFLSLIKYADYVFTDSFHALVFSQIYGRECAVFRRDGGNTMSNRIYSAMELFGCSERFCNTDEKEALDYIESLPPADPERCRPKLDALRKRSLEFLEENLSCQEPPISSKTSPTASPKK